MNFFSVTVDSNEPDANSIPKYLRDFVHFDEHKWMWIFKKYVCLKSTDEYFFRVFNYAAFVNSGLDLDSIFLPLAIPVYPYNHGQVDDILFESVILFDASILAQ